MTSTFLLRQRVGPTLPLTVSEAPSRLVSDGGVVRWDVTSASLLSRAWARFSGRHPDARPFARVSACAAGCPFHRALLRQSPIRSSFSEPQRPRKRSETMSREDPKVETWLSDAQLAKCARADTDPFPSPIPTQIVSNGEWMPMPQTEEQQRIEVRTNELADAAAKKLGMSRRKFMATTGGMAATFLAMNEVFGRYFNVNRDAVYEGEAFAEDGPPKDLFIFDDQLHMIRRSKTEENRALRALAQGYPGAAEFHTNPFNPPLGSPPGTPQLPYELALRGNLDVSNGLWRNWNPALIRDPMDHEIFHLQAFIKSLFLDSQMTVGLLSNITGFLPVFVTGTEPKNVFDARSIEVLTAA